MNEPMSIQSPAEPAAPEPSSPAGQQQITSPPSRPGGTRRLYRSRNDRVLGGVCGGLAEYFDVDPVLVRIAAVALAVSGGLGVVAYLVAWIAVPERPFAAEILEPEMPEKNEALGITTSRRLGATIAVGVILMGTGIVMLLDRVAPWFNGAMFWPIVVIAVGAVLVSGAGRRRS
jgi:phage shock protein C